MRYINLHFTYLLYLLTQCTVSQTDRQTDSIMMPISAQYDRLKTNPFPKFHEHSSAIL